MKSFCLSVVLLFSSLWLWSGIYSEADLVSDMRQTLSALQAHRQQVRNKEPYIVLVENKWAKELYLLWNNDDRFVVLTPWDLKRGYTRKKKKFSCNKDVYWLGETKPTKQLKQLGSWQEQSGTIKSLPRQWHLYSMKQ